MEGLDGLVATAAYQPEPTAAAAARRFVRDTLQTWFTSGATTGGDGLVDDAVLLTSELVTNAVVHAGTSPDGMPVGVQIVARPWRADVALAVAQLIERECGGWQPPEGR